MMEVTILKDGRKVQAEECLGLRAAIYGPDDIPELSEPPKAPGNWGWFIVCRCCESRGEHTWRPFSSFNGAASPDDGVYSCDPCAGVGSFEVKAA